MKQPLGIIGMILLLHGPIFAVQTITLQDVQVFAPFTDFSSQRRGVKVQFDMKFSEYETEFFNRSYDVYFRLETWDGETVFDSRLQQKSIDRKVAVRPDKPWNDPNVNYMVDRDVTLFIPFQNIELESGEYDLKLILSVEGKTINLPDCASLDLHITHEKFEIHDFSEQEFEFSDLTVTYDTKGFGTKQPGFDLDIKLALKYGPNEVIDPKYTLTWSIHTLDGTTVYESKKANSLHHREKAIRLKDMEPGKPKPLNIFIDYADVALGGPETVEFRFYAKASSGTAQQVYAEKKAVDLPQRYALEQQTFKLTNLKMAGDTKDGVSGLSIDFYAEFGETGPRSDPERGAYHFFPVLLDQKGNRIFNGKTETELSIGTTQVFYGLHPVNFPTGGTVRLFLP